MEKSSVETHKNTLSYISRRPDLICIEKLLFWTISKPIHFFYKQLDFWSSHQSCLLIYLVFQPSQNDWYPLKTHILTLFLLFNVIDKFATVYFKRKAILTKNFSPSSLLTNRLKSVMFPSYITKLNSLPLPKDTNNTVKNGISWATTILSFIFANLSKKTAF